MDNEEELSIEEMAAFVKKYNPIFKRLEKQLEVYKKQLIAYINNGGELEGLRVKKYRREYYKFRKEATIDEVALLFPELNQEDYSKKVLMDFKELPEELQQKLAQETLIVEKKAAVYGIVVDN